MNKVLIKLAPNTVLPEYKTSGSLGADVRARLDKPLSLHPSETTIVPIGLFVALPENLALFVLPRSGQSLHGLQVANSPGLVDPDYRNEIGVLVFNATEDIKVIQPNERIAQIVFIPVIRPHFEITESLVPTGRKGGFGHTGHN